MIELDDWQREALDYDGDLLLCTGRRIGKTHLLGIKAVEEMKKKPNLPVICVSLTEDQAFIVFSMAYNYAMEKYIDDVVLTGKDKPTMSYFKFKNGSSFESRPVGNSGDATRGFDGGILIVDEASRMPENRFWTAAKPILMTKNGKIWMASTLHGKKGYFWKSYEDAYIKKNPDARFKVIRMTTPEAIMSRKLSPTWTQEQRDGALRILALEEKEMTDAEYKEEFLCIPQEEINQFFSDEWIDKVCTGKKFEEKANKFMGVDIARLGGDLIVYADFHKANTGMIYQCDVVAKQGQVTTKTEDDIIDYSLMWNSKKVGIDAGSGALGVGILDRLLLHPRMKYIVVAMNNRSTSLDKDGEKRQKLFKEDMYNRTKALGERGELVLLDNEGVRASLRSVQIEYKDDGSIRIHGLFTHHAEAIVRGVELAYKEKVNKLWISYI